MEPLFKEIEKHKSEPDDEEEIYEKRGEEPNQPEVNVQYTLPTMRFEIDLDRRITVNLIAAGTTDKETRKSFDILVKLLNEKVNLNNKSKEEKKKKMGYIG